MGCWRSQIDKFYISLNVFMPRLVSALTLLAVFSLFSQQASCQSGRPVYQLSKDYTSGDSHTSRNQHLQAVELDFKNSKQSTDKFDYKKSDKTVTYTAKAGYGFSKVRTQSVQVWSASQDDAKASSGQASNSKVYATKVVVQGIGEKKKTVILTLTDGSTKKFHRDCKGKPWVDQSPAPPSQDQSGSETGKYKHTW